MKVFIPYVDIQRRLSEKPLRIYYIEKPYWFARKAFEKSVKLLKETEYAYRSGIEEMSKETYNNIGRKRPTPQKVIIKKIGG